GRTDPAPGTAGRPVTSHPRGRRRLCRGRPRRSQSQGRLMPTAICDGIETHYEVLGSGSPLLMFSPGGFNGALENWRTFGIYERLRLLDHLPEHYTCIAFDKRESGRSGGRVDSITWNDYAAQGLGLLDVLEIERADLLGGCIGCSIATTL